MSKYDPLARFLSEVDEDSITLSFGKVHDLVIGGLPQSAYDYRPWWANRNDGTGSQNQGWQSVGWESSDVDMDQKSVTFIRIIKKRADFKEIPYIKPLTIDEAKQGLGVMFNVDYKSIDIIIRG